MCVLEECMGLDISWGDRLGAMDPRPGYHTATALWPVGLCAEVADAEAGIFRSEIVDGAADSPIFRVTLQPPKGNAEVRSMSSL